MVLNRLLTPAIAFLLVAAGPLDAKSETTLLCFSSPSCGPCLAMQPTLRRMSRAGHNLTKIDVTADPTTAQRYRVKSVPTFIVLVNGQEASRLEGSTNRATLTEMLRKSEQLAGRPPSSPSNLAAPAHGSFPAIPAADAFPPIPSVSADGPATLREGKVTQLQSSQPGLGRLTGVASATNATLASGASCDKLIASSVKITIDDADGQSNGTGTIVDARQGQALILTCGHLFRDSEGRGGISVTLYDSSSGGPVERGTVPGKLIDYDLDRDLGLVAIKPGMAVQAVAIGQNAASLAAGGRVTSVGCNRGAKPTAVKSQIKTVNRYQGHPNVQVGGAPVEGRSGGGLFDERGQLIGVCFAADPQSNEGLYASLPSIQAKLDSLNLTMVYRQPSLGGHEQLAAAPPVERSPAVSGFDALAAAPSQQTARGQDAVGTPPAKPLSATERAGLEEIVASAAHSEVVVVVRPKTAGGKSEVFTLRDVSPEFVEKLLEVRSASSAAGTLLR